MVLLSHRPTIPSPHYPWALMLDKGLIYTPTLRNSLQNHWVWRIRLQRFVFSWAERGGSWTTPPASWLPTSATWWGTGQRIYSWFSPCIWTLFSIFIFWWFSRNFSFCLVRALRFIFNILFIDIRNATFVTQNTFCNLVFVLMCILFPMY